MWDGDGPYKCLFLSSVVGSFYRYTFFLLWCFTTTETVWLIRDGERMGHGTEPRPASLFTQLLSSEAAVDDDKVELYVLACRLTY